MHALWDIDLAFADVVSTTLTAQLGAIRLAWWRERLEDLDRGIGPPAEPRLQRVAASLIPAGITGAELSRLEDCWLPFLSPFPWGEAQVRALTERGAILFGIAARLLGLDASEAEPLGAAWSVADAARHCSDRKSAAFLRDRAEAMVAELSRKRLPRKFYPLTVIVVRMAYDLLHGDRYGWHRMRAALRFVLFGQMPR